MGSTLGWDPALVSAMAGAASVVVAAVLAMINYRYMRLTRRIAEETAAVAEETAAVAKETAAARRGTVFIQADRMLVGVRERRHQLYDLPRDFRDWTPEELKLVNDVSVVYQRVAYLWALGLLEKELFAEGWGKTFIDTWDIIEPWVREYRTETKAPNQRIHLERLVRELKSDPKLIKTIYPPSVAR
jgi:hypothetical protein